MEQTKEATPMCRKLTQIVSGLPFEEKLKARMILLGVNDPEDFQSALKDPEFRELLCRSLHQVIQAFVHRRSSFVPSKEDREDLIQEVSGIVWDAIISKYDPSRGVPLLQFCSSLFLRTFNVRNRQQRTQSREIVVSDLWDANGDYDDHEEDFWEAFSFSEDLVEKIIKREELEKITFLEGYREPEELAEAIENASKVKRHRWRKKLSNLKDQPLRQSKPKVKKGDENAKCEKCKEGFHMRSAFKAFGAKYLIAECPVCHCRVIVPIGGDDYA